MVEFLLSLDLIFFVFHPVTKEKGHCFYYALVGCQFHFQWSRTGFVLMFFLRDPKVKRIFIGCVTCNQTNG